MIKKIDISIRQIRRQRFRFYLRYFHPLNSLWLRHGKSKIRQIAASQCRQWQSNDSKNRGVLLPTGEGDKSGNLEFNCHMQHRNPLRRSAG